MSSQDYYARLGIGRTASAEDIKSAYRAKARKLHPDVNKTPQAAKDFAAVQEAYDVLSDPGKRSLYDQFGESGVRNNGSGAGAGSQYGARARPQGGQPGARSRAEHKEVPFDFEDEDLGGIFDAIFGSKMGRPPTAEEYAAGKRSREPQAQTAELRVEFMTAVKGGTQSFQVSRGPGPAKTIEVRIPPGIEDGSQLRVRGSDKSGADLLLTIRVGPHGHFRRGELGDNKGLDLFLDLPLSLAESTLGATVEIPTISGRAEVTVPPASASGKRLRVRGQGVRDEQGRFGDLVLIVQIVPPDPGALTDLEKEALRRIGASAKSVRAGAFWHGGR
jgi:DnaJ-class molecular chaperone